MSLLESAIRAGVAALILGGVAAGPSRAEPVAQLAQAGNEEIAGTWFSVERPGGVRLSEDGVVQFNGNQEWTMDAQTCTIDFGHAFRSVDGQTLLAELTQTDVSDNDGVPIAQGLQGRLPDGDLPVLETSCHGASEIGGAVYYALVAPDRLLAVAFGDGIYGIENYQREPPLVPPQAMDRETREAVQRALQARGLYEDDIDGLFGPGTRGAIGDYQETLGDEPSGVLNQHQLDLLLSN